MATAPARALWSDRDVRPRGVPFGERSELTFLFRRAAGEEIFDPEAPNKQFLLDFEAG